MSLLFERAIRRFDRATATLLDGADDPLADAADAAIDGDALATLVSNRADVLADPDHEDRCFVPLHAPGSAELDGEYVTFEDHPVRGPVFIYGDDQTVGAGDLSGTYLARRLRFWLPDAVPDEQPSYVEDGPTTRVSPVRQPEDDPEAYLDRLRDRLDEEQEAVRADKRERASHHTAGELAADGIDAIPNIESITVTADGDYQVHASPPGGDTHGDVRDRFGIFEDDEVLIHGGHDAPPDFPVPATVLRFARFTMDLRLHDSVEDKAAVERYLADAPTEALGLSLLLNPVTYDRQLASIGAVRNDRDRLELVTGRRDATFARSAARETARRDADLDPSQELAATAALYADDICCIHGPPGTGKTRALVEVVRRTVAHGDRVLVCADSNQGVDNLLVGASTPGDPDPHSLHYHAESDELSLSRHRAGNSDQDLVSEQYGHGTDEGRADVVAATNSGAAEFDVDNFDLAVVDEATQATVASTFAPFTRAERTVLAGDHRQLPPFEPGVDVPPDRHHSLFERLYEEDGIFGSAIGVRLDTQYRMHPAIAEFSNEQFYGGTLANGIDVSPIDDLPPLVGVDVAGEESVDETGSHANEQEADCVTPVVERIIDAGLDPTDIGVITPYDAQIGVIRSALGSLAADVSVDTIDSFQGGEREAIVISFVRSNDGGDIGFLARPEDGPRRLNVALTRAERFCCLVGDWETIRASHRNENATTLYRDLHDHLTERGLLVDSADEISSAGR